MMDRTDRSAPSLLMGALDAMAVHIAVLDEHGTILLVNRAWRTFGEQNGLTMEDAGVGVNYLQVCGSPRVPSDPYAWKAREMILDLLAGRLDAATFEYPCHSPDAQRWFIFRGSRFQLEGETRVVVSHDDITSRHLMEDALRASHDALESFNLAVSHDLRAPLRRIEELVLIAEDAEEDAAIARQEMLARIRAEAARARVLANDLLDLSHVSGASVERMTLDLSKMSQDALDLITSVEDRAREITIEPGMVARGDPRLVGSILSNLLTNAWKFTRGVPVTRIEVGSETDEQGRQSFFVRDNGIGFTKKEAERLFRPFSRLENARTYEGTGVGLAIVQRAIERHGGRVWATGAPNEGATFHFSLSVQ